MALERLGGRINDLINGSFHHILAILMFTWYEVWGQKVQNQESFKGLREIHKNIPD